jgi:hypothetical protein
VEDKVRDAYVNDASQRVKRVAEMIKKMVTKIDDRWKKINKNKSYAHAVGGHNAGIAQAIRVEALSMALTEEKRIIVRLPNATTAEIIKE